MSTGIKTCARCGAKNFLEFKTCFNCGGTEFVADREAAPAARRVPEGLARVRPVEVPAAAEAPKAEQPRPAVRPAVKPTPAAAETERRTIFDNKREIAVGRAEAEGKRPVRRPLPPLEETERTASKLNMQAQQERLRREAEAKRQAAEQEEMLGRIAQKLEKLEEKLASPAEAPAVPEAGLEKLETAIGEMKSESRELAETVLAAQRAQIERLEAETRDYQERLNALSEARGRDSETLAYLSGERERLERQLEAEKARFELLLSDREQIKKLTEVNRPELPADCVVFTGERTDSDYLEYAKRQFLKIYPKIETGSGGEDVIYYIPGEFKNPPVLVLNPDIAKDYKRNIKINMVTGAAAPAALEAGTPSPEEPAEEAAPAAPLPAAPALQPESVGEVAAMETLGEILRRIEQEEPLGAEKAPEGSPAPTEPAAPQEQPAAAETWTAPETPEKEPAHGQAPVPGVIDSTAVASIRDIAEITAKQHKSRKRTAIATVLIGVLALLSLATLALDYVATGKGYDMLAALLGFFSKDYVNSFLLMQAAAGLAGGSLRAIADYMCLFGLFSVLATLGFSAACFAHPAKAGGMRVLRYALLGLTLALDAFLFLSVPLVFGIKDLAAGVGAGLWVKLAADIAALALSVVLVRNFKEKKRSVEPKRPLDIVDKREAAPSIQLDESMQRVRNEIAGK